MRNMLHLSPASCTLLLYLFLCITLKIYIQYICALHVTRINTGAASVGAHYTHEALIYCSFRPQQQKKRDLTGDFDKPSMLISYHIFREKTGFDHFTE